VRQALAWRSVRAERRPAAVFARMRARSFPVPGIAPSVAPRARERERALVRSSPVRGVAPSAALQMAGSVESAVLAEQAALMPPVGPTG